MSSLLEKALKKIEDSNNIREKEEIQKDDKPIEIKDLKPPREKLVKSPKIDFNKIANKAYFQRFIQNLFKDIMPEMFKGIDFRVSKDVAVEIFDNKIDGINTIVKEIERGSKGAFNLVVKELKEKLAKQKEKIENV